MPLILGANSLAGGGYEIDNSLRFNDGSSDYLNKTFGSAGNRKTWTFSTWLKRSDLITSRIFSTIASGVDDYIKFDTSHRIEWGFDHEDLSNRGKLITNRVFRDVSAWYHIVCAVDTTNATAGNRMRIYINGVEETSFATDTNPTQNEDGEILNANPHFISSTSSAQFYDGYMADVYMIDGQALAPSDFGEFDSDTGIWKSIAYTGTYGTNGFFLEFKDSSALGDDTSGEGNDFTVNNLTSIDQTTDTPTNNFATLNPLNYTSSAVTYTQGNLLADFPAAWIASLGNFGVSSGKWFWEAKVISGNNNNLFYGVGVENIDLDSTPYTQTGVICQLINGDRYIDGSYTGSAAETLTNGDILGVALDLDSGTKTVKFYKNGTLLTSSSTINLTSNFNNVFVFPFFAGNSGSANSDWEVNFGNPPFAITTGNEDANGYGNFEYEVPPGYYALCTKNLAEYG
jgi:hypothetical protein